MCSPEVAKAVRERVAREGIPQISRRSFLRLGGMGAAGLAVASALPMRVAGARESMEVIDLTHVFATTVPTYLPDSGPSHSALVTVQNDGFFIQQWTFGEHTGTHVDIPAHFVADGETVDNYAVGNLVGPSVVIDISKKAADNPDAMLDAADIEAWEKVNGDIADGAIVCLYSGWESRWSDATFRNADDQGVQHYPGFSADAATYLLEKRNIRGIAVDTLSLDPGNSTTFDVHLMILGAGKFGVENVANLGKIMGKDATVVVGVPRWEAGSGGPARVLAMV